MSLFGLFSPSCILPLCCFPKGGKFSLMILLTMFCKPASISMSSRTSFTLLFGLLRVSFHCWESFLSFTQCLFHIPNCDSQMRCLLVQKFRSTSLILFMSLSVVFLIYCFAFFKHFNLIRFYSLSLFSDIFIKFLLSFLALSEDF